MATPEQWMQFDQEERERNQDDDSSSTSTANTTDVEESSGEELTAPKSRPQPPASASSKALSRPKTTKEEKKPKVIEPKQEPVKDDPQETDEDEPLRKPRPKKALLKKGGAPKMRIKLSLRLPTSSQGSKTAGGKTTDSSGKDSKKETSSSSTALKNKRRRALPTSKKKNQTPKKPDEVPSKQVSSSKQSHGKGRSANTSAAGTAPPSLSAGPSLASRPIRLPPIASPGLLMVSGLQSNCRGYTTPSLVFDHAMGLAGYTKEGRTSNPHRGSSVQREVGDLFDTDITTSLQFPRKQLLSKDWWTIPHPDEGSGSDNVDSGSKKLFPDAVLEQLGKFVDKQNSMIVKQDEGDTPDAVLSSKDGVVVNNRKRKRSATFMDMVPPSLKYLYPKKFVHEYQDYIHKVEAREKAIVASQEAQAAAEEANEVYEEAKDEWMAKVESTPDLPMPVPPPIPAPIIVPPIPIPPIPPTETDENADKSKESVKDSLVSHLDPGCFQPIFGRYNGLSSNNVADPQFVGPNAPGIEGLNSSSGSGLATSYTSGNAVSYGVASVSSGTIGSVGANGASHKSGMGKKSKASPDAAPSSSNSKSSTAPASSSSTSSSMELKRIMEQGDDLSEKMRKRIIRAAVYASRSGTHGGPFLGANGQTYPDVSKAFANYAGLRPCNRCKSNKQGAYHCRLRRKHPDPDYDGGDSPALLKPLFEEPMENLLSGDS